MLEIFFCLLAWTIVSLCLWRIWQTFREGIAYLKRLHQIPCNHCVFFTRDYHLKCTVHPMTALSEEAIGCRDFEPTFNYFSEQFSCPGCQSIKNAHKN